MRPQRQDHAHRTRIQLAGAHLRLCSNIRELPALSHEVPGARCDDLDLEVMAAYADAQRFVG